VQHRLSPDAENVAQHAAPLHVAALQNLLDAIPLAGCRAQQPLPPPGQLAQLSDRPIRHETRFDQPVPMPVRQPDGVLHVGLVALQTFK